MADEWGFGSPSAVPGGVGTLFDIGFGTPGPDAISVEDEGFGDFIVTIEASAYPDITLLPDDGGILITVAGEYQFTGPFRGRLIDANGGKHPTSGPLYSAVPGQGVNIFTNGARDALQFAFPAVPPGIYDLELSFGPVFGATVTLTQAFRVVHRPRTLDTYRIRGMLPPIYVTGPSTPGAEDLVT